MVMVMNLGESGDDFRGEKKDVAMKAKKNLGG